MTKNPQKFDATQYKKATMQQWNTAAEAWHRWSPLLSRWLGPGTETMLDMCGIIQGSRVLDVAAGAGEQTMSVARRVGENGHGGRRAVLEHEVLECSCLDLIEA